MVIGNIVENNRNISDSNIGKDLDMKIYAGSRHPLQSITKKYDINLFLNPDNEEIINNIKELKN